MHAVDDLLASPSATRRVSALVSERSVLVVLIAVSIVVRYLFARAVPAPLVMPDELIYGDLARSIAEGGLPAIRGEATLAYGFLYPVLIAPAWLTPDGLAAYQVVKLINAICISLSAVPAYLLARRFVSRRSALLVAGATLAMPAMAYAGLVFTENLFFPVFLVALLGMERALASPTTGRQLAALGLIAVAVCARPQGMMLGAAYVASIVLGALLAAPGRRWDSLWQFRASFVVSSSITVAVVSVGPLGLAGGRGLYSAYEGVAEAPGLSGLGVWIWITTAGLVLSTAIVPALATATVVARGIRGRSAVERRFAIFAAPLVSTIVIVVAWFSAVVDVNGRESLNERYFFYLVPVAFVGLALWIERGLPRARRISLATALTVVVLIATLPVSKVDENVGFQAPSLIPWALAGGGLVVAGALCVFASALAVLWLRTSQARVGRLWLAVVGISVVLSTLAGLSSVAGGQRSLDWGIGSDRGWVDRSLPPDAVVTVVWRERGTPPGTTLRRHRIVWLNELFSDRVERVIVLGQPMPYGLPEVPARLLAPDYRVVGSDGEDLAVSYVLAACDLGVHGVQVAVDVPKRAEIVKASKPLRLGGPGRC